MEISDLNQRLKDMAWLLNDLVMDLKTPTDLMIQFKGQHAKEYSEMSLVRMCISSIVINLCKLDEIIKHYGKEIKNFPEDLKKELYSTKKIIENKGMYSYRSTYLAHVFIKGSKKGKPLEFSNTVDKLKKIIGKELNPPIENAYKFCEWVYHKDDVNSVVLIIEQAVKHIKCEVGGLGKRE